MEEGLSSAATCMQSLRLSSEGKGFIHETSRACCRQHSSIEFSAMMVLVSNQCLLFPSYHVLPPTRTNSMSSSFYRNARHDSGVAFNMAQPCGLGSDAFSDSDTSHSVSSSTSPSSVSSSLASSPALRPTLLDSCVPDDLFAELKISPSSNQITSFAATCIRNEAYALLALAARIAPLEAVHESRSTGSDEDAASEASSEMDVGIGWTESRSNVAFMDVVRSLSGLPAHGKVVVTGVGKSGIVGKKMVATFNSLGEPPPSYHSAARDRAVG
jgi:hypothetical protein